jgi:hypothetical protein
MAGELSAIRTRERRGRRLPLGCVPHEMLIAPTEAKYLISIKLC